MKLFPPALQLRGVRWGGDTVGPHAIPVPACGSKNSQLSPQARPRLRWWLGAGEGQVLVGERGQDMAVRLSHPPSPPAYCVFQLWNDEVDKVSSCGVGKAASLWL